MNKTLPILLMLCLFSTAIEAGESKLIYQAQNGYTLVTRPDVAKADQCDTTAECKEIHGERATDCRNSGSNQSVCYCGSTPCSTPTQAPENGFPGLFDPERDIFFAFYDNRPDADDIHSQAGVATLLADQRFQGVDFYSVLGTYGKQGGAFLNSSTVMNLCFGAANWSNAHPKDGPNWVQSLSDTLARSLDTFDRDGDIWIMEAGQSDFSADLVRLIKQERPALDLTQRMHIVQHSAYNEKETTPADLAYVQANTDYQKIPDGNSGGNGSPQLRTNSAQNWALATSLPEVGPCWAEARRVADENNFSGNGHYENPAIEAGGFDFSDVVEATWIFGFNSLTNVDAFFDEFPKLPVNPPSPPGPSNGSDAAHYMPAIHSILMAEESVPSPASGAFLESGGVVVIDIESLSIPSGWQSRTGDGSIDGYIEWTSGNNFNSPGNGTITANVFISEPGTYQFLWRSSIRNGTDTTEHNDSWLKILADQFYGLKNQSIVCPKGSPSSNACQGGNPNGSSSDGWFKIYRSGGAANDWKWQASTSDNDAHDIYADFSRAGNYRIQISARSSNHGLDRLVLFRSRNPSSNVGRASATSSSRAQSQRQP